MGRKENLSNMKLSIIVFLLAFPLQLLAQNDLIILRDGSERKGKVVMVTNENTSYTEGSKKSSAQETVQNISIYMIKYEKRGNVFFTEDGKRISGEGDGKVPVGASAIYLFKGKEIIAYNVSLVENKVQYYDSKKKGSPQLSVPSDEVFLIRYSDGTKDLMNTFEDLKRREAEELAEKMRLEEEARLAELRNRYPKDAIIMTQKNMEIRVSLLSENDDVVTYKKVGLKNSPVFNMDKTNIKEIKYINE